MEYRLIVVVKESADFCPEFVYIQVGEKVERVELSEIELHCLRGIAENALDEIRGGK